MAHWEKCELRKQTLSKKYGMKHSENELDTLEEHIMEEVEFLQTTTGDEIQCISMENLEGILTRFFGRKISLTS